MRTESEYIYDISFRCHTNDLTRQGMTMAMHVLRRCADQRRATAL